MANSPAARPTGYSQEKSIVSALCPASLKPAGKKAESVRCDGSEVPHSDVMIEESPYADFGLRIETGATVEIGLTREAEE